MNGLFHEGVKMNYLFKKGDRVEITSDCQSHGEFGTVIDYVSTWRSSNIVRVQLDSGDRKKYNELSLKKSEAIEREAKEMSITGNFRVARVQFIDGCNKNKIYGFALFDNDVVEGDYVLCDTQNGHNIAKVINIETPEQYGTGVTKEIICKVDFSAYEHRKEIRKQKSELKAKLDKAIRENQDLVLYETVAKSNTQVAELLDKYKALLEE